MTTASARSSSHRAPELDEDPRFCFRRDRRTSARKRPLTTEGLVLVEPQLHRVALRDSAGGATAGQVEQHGDGRRAGLVRR
jgi:hypothetical protein